ncbi:ribonuclease H2 subunit C [Exophiala viscosa]|uniref:ribonuclease H2 subunit C n=1 Tax=Exophiala viscosa TaxID=2486360 RepID=UPI00218E886C|nr:ribonuclease H2 subunit C [Exophiala viscosa]
MLALQQSSAHKSTANILPCRIHHDGPTKVTKRYWSPADDKDGTKTSHFRGRRLRGRVIKLPADYQGVVAKSTDRYLPQSTKSQSGPTFTAVDEDIEIEEEEEEPPEPVRILEQVSAFDEVLVWGHDQLPSSDDPFVKGIEEWISFAEAIHGKPAQNIPLQQTQDGSTS